MRPGLTGVCWFRLRSRSLVILKYSRNLAEEALLLVGVLLLRGILPVCRLGRCRHFFPAAQQTGEESLDSRLRVARVPRLSAGYKSRNIVVRASRRSQPVR